MVRLNKSSLILLLTLLLALELLACPVFSASLNKTDTKAIKIEFPEAEAPNEAAIFQKGMSYTAWSSDAFSYSEADESLELLMQTNTEWVAICFSWFQSSTTSYDIHLDASSSPTTESVKHAITAAHSLGLKVMLKPMVEATERKESLSYPVWRGEIQPSDEWFESYSSFINFFAEFAEENNVELFCVGCEYKQTTGETEQWENVIQGVREHYPGPITYAADWTNYQNIEWWDSLDYVGIDAYFPLTLLDSDPTFEELKTVWINHADEIEAWLATVNKPVIFTEIGYRSGDGTSMAPSNYWTDMAVDVQEQNDCYEAAFQTLWTRSWFSGFYWWTWTTKPAEGGLDDSGHVPQNKPTQDVIASWYSLDRKVAVVDQTFTSAQKCGINEAQLVGFHVSWEHDGADVVGTSVYVNGTEHVTNGTGWITFSAVYSTVGERSWVVTSFEHHESSGYTLAVESPRIVWDQIIINIKVDLSFGTTKVTVKPIHVYDQSAVTGATIFVNDKTCAETELGIYELIINSWNPIQSLTVKTDATELPTETLTTSTVHTLNIILYAVLAAAIIIVPLVVFLKRRHKSQLTP
ncbi:MAG: hypothetical protein NWF06_09870 [Candidatus Bathyarchaeota archaeon]|nr:hypothetical protein [Candidatus Bathyarchaeum sp.]